MGEYKSRWRIVETSCPYTNDIEEYTRGYVCREVRISDARLIRATPELFGFTVELRDILSKNKEKNEELLSHIDYVLGTITDDIRDENIYLKEGVNFFPKHIDMVRK